MVSVASVSGLALGLIKNFVVFLVVCIPVFGNKAPRSKDFLRFQAWHLSIHAPLPPADFWILHLAKQLYIKFSARDKDRLMYHPTAALHAAH